MLVCEIYAAVTLAITTLWIYSARSHSLSTLAWAMFFPGLFAPLFAGDTHFVHQVLGTNQPLMRTVGGTALSMAYVIIALFIVYVINRVTGWGQPLGPEKDKSEVKLRGSLSGFLRAAGEEVGWRCYLLPCLLARYDTVNALFYSGIVWGLYHLPVMLVLTSRYRVQDRWKTVIVQASQCVISAFIFGHVAIYSGFSVWAPALMHYLWNVLNPWLYGSVYMQTPGTQLVGDLWLVNGEGLAGCLAWLALALGYSYSLAW